MDRDDNHSTTPDALGEREHTPALDALKGTQNERTNTNSLFEPSAKAKQAAQSLLDKLNPQTAEKISNILFSQNNPLSQEQKSLIQALHDSVFLMHDYDHDDPYTNIKNSIKEQIEKSQSKLVKNELKLLLVNTNSFDGLTEGMNAKARALSYSNLVAEINEAFHDRRIVHQEKTDPIDAPEVSGLGETERLHALKIVNEMARIDDVEIAPPVRSR